MTAGLKVINDYGTIQIDDTYPVQAVMRTGSATLSANGLAYLGDYTGMVAVRCSSVCGYAYFNATEPFARGLYLVGTAGATVDWYLFDQVAEPASKFGLVVRNPQGVLTFDAAARPARVAAIRSGSSVSAWAGSVSLPAGRSYAVMALQAAFVSQMTFTREGSGSPDLFYQRENLSVAGASLSGTTATMGMTATALRQYGPYSGASLPTGYTVQSNNAALAVLDVTNY